MTFYFLYYDIFLFDATHLVLMGWKFCWYQYSRISYISVLIEIHYEAWSYKTAHRKSVKKEPTVNGVYCEILSVIVYKFSIGWLFWKVLQNGDLFIKDATKKTVLACRCLLLKFAKFFRKYFLRDCPQTTGSVILLYFKPA